MVHFRRWLIARSVLLAAAWSGAATAHPAFQDQMKRLAESKIPENLDLSRVKVGTAFVVRYAAEAPEGRIPVAELHAWTVAVEAKDGTPVDGAVLELAADMPQHLHGLGSVPRVTPLGRGKFRVEGLNFQMPGWWQITVKVRARDAPEEALRFDLVL